MWSNTIRMEISEHHSTAQEAAERTSRKLSSHFSPSYCQQSLGTFVYSQFYEHVSYLITTHQHGFLRNRSCVTQLLSVLHSIGRKLDTNEQTDIAYLDLAKAFDSVDHSILLQKLKCYGVTGRLLNWFADYLNNRRQRVVMDGATSQWTPVTSGVPQGSILGPMMFVIFINDAPDVINNKAIPALFADDTKLYKNILTSVNDCNQLQETNTP
ncbi:Hypothetical predicted protein [Paramuricea clavata]|uniref:Uncharacterized protein n=1 Tax=Paramuricea clavata TaxID=317549 RepID=A0A7D9IEH8_PARCT|nr:Hypothetical predicted protein [Paramuricea clavata]